MTLHPPEKNRSEASRGLSDFVLGYCRQVGGIVDSPGYGVYDVLLPEELASRLAVEPLQRLTFHPEAAQGADEEVTFLHYGHPLVERIVDVVRCETANARQYVNVARLDQRDLFRLATQSLDVSNAHLSPTPNTTAKRALFHYVCFNFKASLITDEKRDLIVPVWMYLEGGYPVDGEEIERLAVADPDPAYRHLEPGAAAWLPGERALSRGVWKGLLERAGDAVLDSLAGGPLEVLERRARRFLELDRARLEQYYDDLRKDLEKRLRKASDERRPPFESKLAALQSERRTKLADAEEKYRLRVELELINLWIVAQAKLVVPVTIKKRKVSTLRQVVWDPRRSRLEPPLCEACREPASQLWLCENGHLTHKACRRPQCVDCSRTYCRLCSEQMRSCVVCDRPLCEHSVNHCATCGRGTCREHVGLCHGADGAPVPGEAAKPEKALAVAEPPTASTSADSETEPPPSQAKKPRPSKARTPRRTAQPKVSAKRSGQGRAQAKAKRGGAFLKRKTLRAQRLEVYSEVVEPAVTAYVVAAGKRMATRRWELAADGIRVYCYCEKGRFCDADGTIIRPGDPEHVEEQIKQQIGGLREEYGVTAGRVELFCVIADQPKPRRRLQLAGRWKDKEVVAQAQRTFDTIE
ncbi:MAG: hypothetical protein GY856_54560 [bacterium]|nr:hypothetical protein [bacterium]